MNHTGRELEEKIEWRECGEGHVYMLLFHCYLTVKRNRFSNKDTERISRSRVAAGPPRVQPQREVAPLAFDPEECIGRLTCCP